MCAIIDANVIGKVFGTGRTSAGKAFFDWLNEGKGSLVVGGHLDNELRKSSTFRRWALQAQRSGILKFINNQEVLTRANELRRSKSCKSDDPHIIALAQTGGARLLYSTDRDLCEDFKNRELLKPRGKIYPPKSDYDRNTHGRLLRESRCPTAQ